MRILASAFVVAGFGLAGSAQAGGALTTPPINSTFGDSDTLFCQVANVGTKTVTVLIESIDVNGAVVNSITHEIDPGAVRGLQELETAQYCRFSGASAKSLRAHAVYYDSAGEHYLLSVPAQ